MKNSIVLETEKLKHYIDIESIIDIGTKIVNTLCFIRAATKKCISR